METGKLSQKAVSELRLLIQMEIGEKQSDLLTDAQIEQYGGFLLTLFVEGLKLIG
jgi:hypothetical protein